MPNEGYATHATRDVQMSTEDPMDLEAASMPDKKAASLDCDMRFDNRAFKKLSRAQRNELVEQVLKVTSVDSRDTLRSGRVCSASVSLFCCNCINTEEVVVVAWLSSGTQLVCATEQRW